MEHHHHHHHQVHGTRLLMTIVLNLAITLAQMIGGIISGSLALLSDAIHNLGDVLGLITAYIATVLAQRPCSTKQTFGYKRAEIFAALLNALFLVITAFYIIFEAVQRLQEPSEIAVPWVIGLALLGIVFNGFSVFLIKDDAHHDLNMKAAYLHLLADTLTSVAVLVGALVLLFFPLYWIDSVISIGIALYLLYASWGVLKEATAMLMLFSPRHIDVHEIEALVSRHSEISNLHHLHLWQLNDHDIYLEAHLDFEEDLTLSQSLAVTAKIEHELHERFHITHITLQAEYAKMDAKQLIHHH